MFKQQLMVHNRPECFRHCDCRIWKTDNWK